MAPETVDRAAVRRLRTPLLRWYARSARDLPWRRTRDPYAIWVSEVMLQQTTVAAALSYWERFLDRFPDVAALAGAREEDVLALWTGLGYYQRARSLRRGAQAVMERHGGCVPGDVDGLLSLPGIGRYTAGAIASVAFGREAPVVDGNVKRVFARVFALASAGTSLEKACWRIAGELVPGRDPGDLNQAVMELGATVCTPRAPRCPACPLAAACRARALRTPEAYPATGRRPPSRRVACVVAWIERGGRVLLERRHDGGPLRGTWDLPAATVPAGGDAASAIARALRARHGLVVRRGADVARVTHTILQTRLAIEVVAGAVAGAPRRAALRWVAPRALAEVATSSATTKIARAVAAQKRSQLSGGTGSSSGSSGRAKAYERPSIRGTAPKATSSPAQ